MVSDTITSPQRHINWEITRVWMGVKPVKPSNTTTLPGRSLDFGMARRTTSRVSSVVMKLPWMYSRKPLYSFCRSLSFCTRAPLFSAKAISFPTSSAPMPYCMNSEMALFTSWI